MNHVIPVPTQPTVPVFGGGVFPVRRIYCVGRNYAEHAQEMGFTGREPPFFFLKPGDTVLPVADGVVGEMAYPPLTANLHHEIELVVCIGKGGRNIPVEKALEHVYGYAVGLDMTRRDLQTQAKNMQRPWEMGKSFDESCPVSAVQPASKIGHPDKGAIWLKINGKTKQSGDLNQQIWPVDEAVAYLSTFVELAPGDIIMNGTPAGVGPCVAGDKLEGHIDGVGDLVVSYVAAK